MPQPQTWIGKELALGGIGRLVPKEIHLHQGAAANSMKVRCVDAKTKARIANAEGQPLVSSRVGTRSADRGISSGLVETLSRIRDELHLDEAIKRGGPLRMDRYRPHFGGSRRLRLRPHFDRSRRLRRGFFGGPRRGSWRLGKERSRGEEAAT